MIVRIGVANAKELEVNVDDVDAVIAAYEKALKDEDILLTVEESGGGRTIVAVGSIVYFANEAPGRAGIGFAAEG